MFFTVSVTEALSRTYIVEAEDESEAEDKMYNAYRNEDIVLDEDDFDGDVQIGIQEGMDSKEDLIEYTGVTRELV